MLETVFKELYTKFKLHFYKEVMSRFQEREASLTTVETFCMETIMALGRPTVNEFATFLEISSPNATYKVNQLVGKGYLKKVRSEQDKREYHLQVTKKYIDYYNITNRYVSEVMARVRDRFSPEELKQFEGVLRIIDEELMSELPTPHTEV
ncbi:MAG: MarR family transcriptional regulator [Eubacterium aggregans]|uniref:DNA-binding transcriptional regulator, MarR family n=1 Tax=Eubacterium aggregans TaxID=81409 RepID=A0A1H4ACT6_9FIRM|nr:MarR family transcriptional regulator [Eubacterium aggregans]MDD4691823.1 MarR family transcriptional regulator [Eubacterium aggregans]MEA5073371.1 MarR family transcriptional regulator [Eubacterium aggregans]SEA33706.1 DNA-binding transcriptional regulator, MarR family [Eubacterium aggregans]